MSRRPLAQPDSFTQRWRAWLIKCHGFTLGHTCLIQAVSASLLAFRSASLGCAPTVVTKCSIAAFTGSGGPYFSSVSANLRASSGFCATIKLSFAKEMSRQVD